MARAVRMVAERPAGEWAPIKHVALLLGVGTPETLRKWVRRAEIEAGTRDGMTTAGSDGMHRPKRESAELRRANSILKAALSSRPSPTGQVIVEFIRMHAD